MLIVRRLREKRGLTQMELATKLGVLDQFISNIERGCAPIPAKHVNKMAKLLECKPETLIVAQVTAYEARFRRAVEKQ